MMANSLGPAAAASFPQLFLDAGQVDMFESVQGGDRLDSCPCSAVFRTLHATRISTRNLFLLLLLPLMLMLKLPLSRPHAPP